MGNITEPDIAVVDIWDDGLEFWEIDAQVRIEVTNYGEETIDYFVLSEEPSWTFNCAEGRTYLQFDEVDLEPGESMWVMMDLKRFEYIYPEEDYQVEACVFIGAPNEKFDLVFENNNSCGIIISDSEEILHDSEIQVFPNPATDILNIQNIWSKIKMRRK